MLPASIVTIGRILGVYNIPAEGLQGLGWWSLMRHTLIGGVLDT